MPFIPHTEQEVAEMLDTIGVDSIEALFDEIPAALRTRGIDAVPSGLSEMEVARLMGERAASCGTPSCFIGAGAYEHHIPAAVWEVSTRGEFYSAYTPYQAEASQGSLQLVYEYQSMMAHLAAMDVSNASLYDGASALAEAVLMAVRANRKSKSKRVLVPRTVHPTYRKVAQVIVRNQGIELIDVAFSTADGHVLTDALKQHDGEDFAALVVQSPNYFGVLEDADALTDWAHRNNALVIAVANPLSFALLKPPGEWGGQGADIACGEGQPFGIPLASGGPYFGYMCCRQQFVRQMPGRIVGRTVDLDGKPGFSLTLQAREQHIRRSKATSNICTNQGLMVTAATQYMAILGPQGLQRVASQSHHNTRTLVDLLTAIDGVSQVFSRPFFHETVVRIEGMPVTEVLDRLADADILGGYPLQEDYPELADCLLVCATETKTPRDIENYAARLADILR